MVSLPGEDTLADGDDDGETLALGLAEDEVLFFRLGEPDVLAAPACFPAWLEPPQLEVGLGVTVLVLAAGDDEDFAGAAELVAVPVALAEALELVLPPALVVPLAAGVVVPVAPAVGLPGTLVAGVASGVTVGVAFADVADEAVALGAAADDDVHLEVAPAVPAPDALWSSSPPPPVDWPGGAALAWLG